MEDKNEVSSHDLVRRQIIKKHVEELQKKNEDKKRKVPSGTK